MQIICAWCEEFIREKEPLYDKSISHGICERCFAKAKREIRELASVRSPQDSKKRATCLEIEPKRLESDLK